MKSIVTLFIILLTIITITISCQKESLHTLGLDRLGSRTDMHPDTLYEIILNTFARGLILSSKDSNFRNSIHDMANDEFTGDFEVLAHLINQENDNFRNTLKTSIDSISTSYSSGLCNTYKLSSNRYSADLDTIDMIMDGFPYDSNTFFPQIYIPFYDSIDLAQDPVIAIVTEDSSVIWGYQHDSYSNVYNVIEIDESFAKNNLVWVIDVNEQLQSTDELDTLLAGGPNSNFDTLEARDPFCAIYFCKEILISKHLEKWHGGRNCVAFKSQITYESSGSSKHAFLSNKMTKKISKRKLNEWHNVDQGVMADNDFPLCQGESLDFIIYEIDPPRRKFEKVMTPWFSGDCDNDGLDVIYYSSRQTDFFVRSFPYCSRRYSDLGNKIIAHDVTYSYSGYNGAAKMWYGK